MTEDRLINANSLIYIYSLEDGMLKSVFEKEEVKDDEDNN